MLGLALGAKTHKMHQGHHGANHPVKDHTTGKVEIVSMNHGFAIDAKTLPSGVEETHVSLFDQSNCGIRLKGKPVFLYNLLNLKRTVWAGPELSPGKHTIAFEFTPAAPGLGKGGTGVLKVDGKEVARQAGAMDAATLRRWLGANAGVSLSSSNRC